MSGPGRSGVFIPLLATDEEVAEILALPEGYEPKVHVVLPDDSRRSSSSSLASGERPEFREGMDRMLGQMIEHGASREYAESKVRECARRNHDSKGRK